MTIETRPQRIVITGGTGFVGRTLCRRLAHTDTQAQLVVPTRRLAQGQPIQMLPGVELVECRIGDAAQLPRVLAGADALVHLVAILHGGAAAFEQVHVALPRTLAAACRAAGVRRVVHVSALGVAPDAPSLYLRSKAAGEAVWRASGLDLTVLRPSVMFGAEDRFTRMFARLLRWLPVLPLAGAAARFQPVWVGDVAEAIRCCLHRPDLAGATIECAGPEAMTLAEIVRAVGAMTGCRRPVIPLPDGLARLQAALMALAPGEPLMSPDNLDSMRVPNVASGTLPGLQALGIEPAALRTMARHLAR